MPTAFSSAHVGHVAPLAWHAAPRMYHMHKSCNKWPATGRRSPLVCVGALTEQSQQRKPANEDVEGSMLDPSLANKNTVRPPCGWFTMQGMFRADMTSPTFDAPITGDALPRPYKRCSIATSCTAQVRLVAVAVAVLLTARSSEYWSGQAGRQVAPYVCISKPLSLFTTWLARSWTGPLLWPDARPCR